MALRRLLARAERFSESAIRRGLVDLKTFGWRSSALLRCVTRADHRRVFERVRAFDFLRDLLMDEDALVTFQS